MIRPACLVLVLAGACTDEPTASPGPAAADPCGAGSDRYLPVAPGLRWTYQVTELDSGERKRKEQSIAEAIDDPQLGPVLVQLTGKRAGSTRSLLRVDGDRVVRLSQDDLDATGAVERTTRYDPGQIRIDESAARTVPGAAWEETYQEHAVEPGGAPTTVATRDRWEVIAVDVACTSGVGTLACLHLRRTRIEGGIAVKEFWFARGVGKVRETGDRQIEELTACGR